MESSSEEDKNNQQKTGKIQSFSLSCPRRNPKVSSASEVYAPKIDQSTKFRNIRRFLDRLEGEPMFEVIVQLELEKAKTFRRMNTAMKDRQKEKGQIPDETNLEILSENEARVVIAEMYLDLPTGNLEELGVRISNIIFETAFNLEKYLEIIHWHQINETETWKKTLAEIIEIESQGNMKIHTKFVENLRIRALERFPFTDQGLIKNLALIVSNFKSSQDFQPIWQWHKSVDALLVLWILTLAGLHLLTEIEFWDPKKDPWKQGIVKTTFGQLEKLFSYIGAIYFYKNFKKSRLLKWLPFTS